MKNNESELKKLKKLKTKWLQEANEYGKIDKILKILLSFGEYNEEKQGIVFKYNDYELIKSFFVGFILKYKNVIVMNYDLYLPKYCDPFIKIFENKIIEKELDAIKKEILINL